MTDLVLGLAMGAVLCVGLALIWYGARRPRHALPAATPRALARVQRRNRADIREALARHGIELHEERAPAEPAIIPLPVDDFDADDKETW